MFYYLEGTLAHSEPFLAVVDCAGVGYMCHVSTMTLSKIKLGTRCRLYTHLNVREDTFDIYGFADIEDVFELLGFDEVPEDVDSETIGGLVTDLLARIPKQGEQPTVKYQNLELTALGADERRITSVLVRSIADDESKE